MGIGSCGDKRTSGCATGRGWKSATAVGICAALTTILAPVSAAANPLGEVVENPKAAVEGVVSTALPPTVTSPAVPPLPPPPVSAPPPVKTPPISVPPAPEAIPSPPKPPPAPPAVKVPLPSVPPSGGSAPKVPEDAAAHVPHGPGPAGPDFGSSSGGKSASPAMSTAAVNTANSGTAKKLSEPRADPGRGVSPSPPTVSPGVALPHWISRVWPAVSLGRIGRALVGRALYALGLGSLTAPRLIVGVLPPIPGFQPAIGSPHFGVLAEEDASKRGEPSGGPSVGPIHSNPETVAFVILAGLMALAALAVGSEFSVFRRPRRW